MKIIFSAKGREWDSQLDPRFGRAQGFLLYDTDNDQLTWHSNEENIHAAHGAGIQAAQNAADLKAEVLITGHVGPKADSTLKSSGIEVFDAQTPCTIKEAYEQYRSSQQ